MSNRESDGAKERGRVLRKYLHKKRHRDLNIIWANGPPEREWQCIECGYVVEAGNRPTTCPHCNTTRGDYFPEIRNLFIPREACGWFE